jgi:hypothetical protein
MWRAGSGAKVGVHVNLDFTRKKRREINTTYFDQPIIHILHLLKLIKLYKGLELLQITQKQKILMPKALWPP